MRTESFIDKLLNTIQLSAEERGELRGLLSEARQRAAQLSKAVDGLKASVDKWNQWAIKALRDNEDASILTEQGLREAIDDLLLAGKQSNERECKLLAWPTWANGLLMRRTGRDYTKPEEMRQAIEDLLQRGEADTEWKLWLRSLFPNAPATMTASDVEELRRKVHQAVLGLTTTPAPNYSPTLLDEARKDLSEARVREAAWLSFASNLLGGDVTNSAAARGEILEVFGRQAQVNTELRESVTRQAATIAEMRLSAGQFAYYINGKENWALGYYVILSAGCDRRISLLHRIESPTGLPMWTVPGNELEAVKPVNPWMYLYLGNPFEAGYAAKAT